MSKTLLNYKGDGIKQRFSVPQTKGGYRVLVDGFQAHEDSYFVDNGEIVFSRSPRKGASITIFTTWKPNENHGVASSIEAKFDEHQAAIKSNETKLVEVYNAAQYSLAAANEGVKGDAGPKGDVGPQGPQGPTGSQGPAGADGPQGPQGIAGPKGDKGDEGDAGPPGKAGPAGKAGPKGDKGDTGPQGPTGADGPQGPQGIAGAKGDTGEKGDKGDKGTHRADTYTERDSEVRENNHNTNNTFIAPENGQSNTTGYWNTAAGSGALNSNTTGFGNTASGKDALSNNTTGSGNTSTGINALLRNTTGHYNTASGWSALDSNTTGSRNVASGSLALERNTTGDRNIGIGYRVHAPTATSSYALNIGDAIKGSLKGRLTAVYGMNVSSDERLKENIKPIDNGLHCVSKLRAVEYTRKEIASPVFEKDEEGNPIYPEVMPEAGQLGSDKKEIGFIAQEVEKVCPELVQTSDYAEGYKSLDYMRMNALLVNAIQSLEKTNKEQSEQMETQDQQIKALQDEVKALKKA